MAEYNLTTEEATHILATYHAEYSGVEYDDARADIQDPDEASTAVMVMLFEINRGIEFSTKCIETPEKTAQQIINGLRVTSHAEANKTVHGDIFDEEQVEKYFQKEASMLAAQFRFTAAEHHAAIHLLSEKRNTVISAATALGIPHNNGIFSQPEDPGR